MTAFSGGRAQLLGDMHHAFQQWPRSPRDAGPCPPAYTPGSRGRAYFFFAWPSAEQGLSDEQRSPITATAWISISTPGRAKLVMVTSALPG
jgi:hypothetical protein